MFLFVGNRSVRLECARIYAACVCFVPEHIDGDLFGQREELNELLWSRECPWRKSSVPDCYAHINLLALPSNIQPPLLCICPPPTTLSWVLRVIDIVRFINAFQVSPTHCHHSQWEIKEQVREGSTLHLVSLTTVFSLFQSLVKLGSGEGSCLSLTDAHYPEGNTARWSHHRKRVHGNACVHNPRLCVCVMTNIQHLLILWLEYRWVIRTGYYLSLS